MNIKNKISFIVSLLFTVIFAASATVIYFLFADFRKEEFENRLKEKALSSIKLLVEVEQIDRQLLKIIDQNSIQKLYNEKTLIFDADYNLIYSSLDDTKIHWTPKDLNYLKDKKTFFRKENENEIYGVFYDSKDNDYFALISATDNYGKRKLEYLLFILVVTYFIFTIFCWFATSFAIRKLLLPLDIFHSKIKSINENNLDIRVNVKDKKDEIDLLANEFNQMLHRIDISYQKQKEFTAHASHELRTPIARVTSQIENKIFDEKVNPEYKGFLKNIIKDINQISDLISSLLLLSKFDNKLTSNFEICRIDELIFDISEHMIKLYPDFKLHLDINEDKDIENHLEVRGHKSLLKIALTNLLKNAYLYSDNKQATVTLSSSDKNLILSISNNGKTLSNEEQLNLFQPFMRGSNSKNTSGFGLGLRIVQRILLQHNAQIVYRTKEDTLNIFTIIFTL